MPKELKDGSVVTFNVSFYHIGAATTAGKIYAAIGVKGVSFNECWATGELELQDVVAHPTGETVNGVVTLPLGTGVVAKWLSEGHSISDLAESYVKIYGVPKPDGSMWTSLDPLIVYGAQDEFIIVDTTARFSALAIVSTTVV